MGAGNFDAGAGDAGHDPVEDPSPAPGRRPAGAIMYDGAAAGWVLDAQGHYRTVHEVDQRVALALVVREGDLASVPGTGSRLRRLGRLSPTRLVTAAQDAVRVALAPMLAAQEIEILSIGATAPSRGKLLVVTKYKNLLLRPSDARVVKTVL